MPLWFWKTTSLEDTDYILMNDVSPFITSRQTETKIWRMRARPSRHSDVKKVYKKVMTYAPSNHQGATMTCLPIFTAGVWHIKLFEVLLTPCNICIKGCFCSLWQNICFEATVCTGSCIESDFYHRLLRWTVLCRCSLSYSMSSQQAKHDSRQRRHFLSPSNLDSSTGSNSSGHFVRRSPRCERSPIGREDVLPVGQFSLPGFGQPLQPAAPQRAHQAVNCKKQSVSQLSTQSFKALSLSRSLFFFFSWLGEISVSFLTDQYLISVHSMWCYKQLQLSGALWSLIVHRVIYRLFPSGRIKHAECIYLSTNTSIFWDYFKGFTVHFHRYFIPYFSLWHNYFQFWQHWLLWLSISAKTPHSRSFRKLKFKPRNLASESLPSSVMSSNVP